MVRFAPWNPDMNMSEEEYKADTTAKSQAWSRGEWPIKTVQSDTFGRGDNRGPRGFGNDVITRPTRDLSRRERNKQRRMELLGGGRRREKEYPSFAPTSGRNLASREDRMRMLTGESDFGGRGSRYGGREEYDRQDREFNRQFDEAPRGPQPWDSPNKPRGWGDVMDRVKPDRDKEIYRGKPPADRNTPGYRGDGWNMGRVETSDNRRSIGGSSPIPGVSGHDFVNNPKSQNVLQNFGDTGSTKGWPVLDKTPTRYDQRQHTLQDYKKGGDVEKMYDEFTGKSTPSNQSWSGSSRSVSEFDPTKSSTWWEGDRKFKLIPEARGGIVDGQWDKDYLVSPPTITEFTPQPGDPDYNPQRQGSQAKYDDTSIKERLRNLENRPQSTGSNWDENRIAALESRGPIVNQSTVDLSGIQERLSALEGKGSDWQEDRIKQLEGRKPQDLTGIQGQLSALENRQDDTSWKDQLTALGTSQYASNQTGTEERAAMRDRLTSLENYYKNDPPPKESTGNRYEDKMASLAKGWDMTGKATKWDLEDDKLAGYRNVRDKSGRDWASTLQQGYVQGVRDLNREYNKPTHTAQIKGREYKAYDPQSAARLRYLDEHNIHEDEYLGRGTWQNQYGEDVEGWDKGYKDRYFTSQSGLDKDSDAYKDRFGSHVGGMGKDYAWYQ